MNLTSAVRTARSVVTANSPVLLVGTAIAGVVTTGILAARAGYKARGIIDEAEQNSSEPLTNQDRFRLTWLCYASPAIVGASTIASVVGVHTIHTKRHAALAGLYAVTTGKLDDYREKAEELLGSKKTQQLNDAVAQKSVDGAPFETSEVIITQGGDQLCYDEWSGRYFYSSVAMIERGVGLINMQLVEAGDASLNEYYDAIGLTPIPMGLRFGWSGTKLEPRFGSVTTPDGRAAVAVWFHEEPKEGLGR